MDVTGACFCGEIQYQATIDEQRIAICHCTDCQQMSGSAFRTACAVNPADFAITSGSPTFFNKQSDAGSTRRLAFCGTCGTHLCSLPEEGEEGGFVSLRVTTADVFEQLRPSIEIFCDSRVDWISPIEHSFQFPRMPEGRS